MERGYGIVAKDIKSVIENAGLDWTRFKNKNVLITGANGFLPAYLVETFLHLNIYYPDLNITVYALVRNREKAIQKFGRHLANQKLLFLLQDVSEPIRMDNDVHFIIHAASQASPKYYRTDPVGTLSANIIGTINLMKLAQAKTVESFLYFSSGEVYGEVPQNAMPIKEDTFGYINPCRVRSCYAESKRMGENICVSYHEQYGVPAKIVRPFHTYGPGMLLDDGRVYADFVADVLNNRDIIMKSDGSAQRAFCYLQDATIGFLKVLLNGTAGEAYNVGNPGEEYTILELANEIASLYPEKGIKVIEAANQQSANYMKSPINRNSPDIEKITTLGWRPSITIQEGFKRTIESYQ